MAENPNPEVEKLAAAVADRFAASAGTARLASSEARHSSTIVARLASAVAQRLAARSGPNIDRLASAVAHRLAASAGAARLASSAARHFARDLIWSDPELERVVTAAAEKFAAK